MVFKRVIVSSLGREMGKLQKNHMFRGMTFTRRSISIFNAPRKTLSEIARVPLSRWIPAQAKILAMVSKPSFDPNLFATRISVADWSGLLKDPRKPLTNRVIQNHFSPGSVFKVFMASAGLEAGTLDPLQTIYCPGHATFYGHTFACGQEGRARNYSACTTRS